jgi:DNA invertase Pin-like site-specific DNA recombinase
LFNALAMVAQFESDLIRARTREGMLVAKAKGHLRVSNPNYRPHNSAT